MATPPSIPVDRRGSDPWDDGARSFREFAEDRVLVTTPIGRRMMPDSLSTTEPPAFSRSAGELPGPVVEVPEPAKPQGRKPIVLRIVVALAAGVLVLLAILTSTGLLVGNPVGAADNGDGARLFCGAGLAPANAKSFGSGGVILDFNRVPPCKKPIPSVAGTILRVAVHGDSNPWSLTSVGWLYATLAATAFALATWAVTRKGLLKALVLVPPLLPLLDRDFARFFVSTFSEPAGLLGAFVLVCGAGVVWVSDLHHRPERILGLVLVAGGGLLAATAKAHYLPLLGVAVLICACTAVSVRGGQRRWYDRHGPVIFALVTVGLAVAPLSAALAWQTKNAAVVNAYNLIYTTVLAEVPGSAAELGLPPEAAEFAGTGYYPKGPEAPGGNAIVLDPDGKRSAAWGVLAEHPSVLLDAVGIAMQSTEGRALPYLPSAPWTPATPAPDLGIAGEQGATTATFDGWLDSMSTPWLPSLLAVFGIGAGIAGTVRRRSAWSVFARIAGAAAVSAVMLAVVAILGDGYFEIAKHVWLAAYLLDVTAVALVGAYIAAIFRWYSHWARGFGFTSPGGTKSPVRHLKRLFSR
jgi:hypothetical protein